MVKKANALSVKAMSLKFNPITAMASSSTRAKDWEDVITAHVEDGNARTWRVQDKRAGRWSLNVGDGTVKVGWTRIIMSGSNLIVRLRFPRLSLSLLVETLDLLALQRVTLNCGTCNQVKSGRRSI
jgi:hypothetical protein